MSRPPDRCPVRAALVAVLAVLAVGFGLGAAAPAAGDPPADWHGRFADLSHGAILIETGRNRLTYWGPDGRPRLEFPVAVARAPELGRTGRTAVVRKRRDPDWRPTAAMRRRDPSLPDYVPPGPANPMGRHALYLGWPHYAIHGTNDPLSVGRSTSSGCFRLYPEDIARLFEAVEPGTPVLVE